MNYMLILKQLSEKEMQNALNLAGLNCSAKEFIRTTAELIKKDYI